MTRETTKEDLLHYLRDDKVRVIALKGLWGTGKTHLWDEVKADYKPVDGRDHLYASCFGLESVEQIKVALFQNSLGKAEGAVSTAGKLSGIAREIAEKFLGKIVPGSEDVVAILGSVGGLVQSAMVDKVLHERLIVLDDIERRGTALGVDTLLGFIDLLKRNDCKILLILNEEPIQQAQKSDWQTLKEKCLDRELMLLTSSIDAAEIGLTDTVPYRTTIIDTLRRLSVTNIRVVQRIDRVVSTLFDGHADLHETVGQSFISSCVVLTALNFNAVPCAPSLHRLMSEWRKNPGGHYRKDNQNSDVSAFALNINLSRDIEFLDLVHSHLLTGHRHTEAFNVLIGDRQTRAARNAMEQSAIQYIDDIYHDPALTDQDFIAMATQHQEAWTTISADKISAIAFDLKQRGRADLADDIAQKWAEKWLVAPTLWSSSRLKIDDFYPLIRDAIAEGNRQLSVLPPLLDAVLHASSSAWHFSDEQAINEASIEQIMETIQALDKMHFSTFMNFYRMQIAFPLAGANGLRFGAGMPTFLEAVKQLAATTPNSRLKEMLHAHLGNLVADGTISKTKAFGAEQDSNGAE